MSEVRARAARHKGQLNFEQEVHSFLYAFGDDIDPLPETVRVLDEIITDFVIETCHQAARSAMYSNRQKIKVDDFKFTVRNNEAMLGRVQELFSIEKHLKEARKLFAEDHVVEGKQHVERSRPAGKEGGGKRGRKPKNREVSEETEG